MLKITLTLNEYILHTIQRGQRWVIIDDERRKEIVSQPNWETECYIEELTEDITKPIFRLWRLSDWQFHKETNHELVKENKLKEEKQAAENHKILIQWKIKAIGELINKGKQSPEAAKKHVEFCVNPTSAPNEKLVKFYIDLRNKLEWPFEK